MTDGTVRLLGIETSCDETAAAVVRDGRFVCSSVVASQVELHAEFGGVFPELASRQHVRDVLPVVRMAMDEAACGFDQLSGVAVTYGPGLSGALLIGVNVAKGLCLARGLPLLPVNHLEGHLYSNWLHEAGSVRRSGGGPAEKPDTASDGQRFPLLALVVSGGHTELVLVRAHGEYVCLGSTLDDAAGEAFDKAARMLGLGYPGGPAIERAALRGDPDSFPLPVAKTGSPLDFSFSGVKTALARIVQGLERKGDDVPVADLAASFQSAVVSALVERVQNALETHAVSEVLIAGGVAANSVLRRRMIAECGAEVSVPPAELCTDNAAMIAAAGYRVLARGGSAGMDLDVVPNLGWVGRSLG